MTLEEGRLARLATVPVAELVGALERCYDCATLAELLWRIGDPDLGQSSLYACSPMFVLERLPSLVGAMREEALQGDLTAASALLIAADTPHPAPAGYVSRAVLRPRDRDEIEALIRRMAGSGVPGAQRTLQLVALRHRMSARTETRP